MGIIKNLIYFLLTIQERILLKSLDKTINTKNHSQKKKYYGNGVFLTLETLADEKKSQIEEEMSLILKNSNYEPEKILEYIKGQGTKVYYIKDAKMLYSVGENEGFIYPQKGAKALYFNLLINKSFGLKTDEMFVLSKGEINKFYFIYHFYNWYAYKHGIFGVDSESISMLNKFLFCATEEEVNKLQLSDIYKLKDAIAQDKASIEFVLKLCKDIEGTKKAFDKLREDGASL